MERRKKERKKVKERERKKGKKRESSLSLSWLSDSFIYFCLIFTSNLYIF